MTDVYDEKLQTAVRKSAAKYDIPLKEGVYIQLSGPSYETKAELKAIRNMDEHIAKPIEPDRMYAVISKTVCCSREKKNEILGLKDEVSENKGEIPGNKKEVIE